MKKNRILEFLEKYYKVFILILFVTLAFIVGVRHEPWLDEAQAWLIARDTSLYSLFFKYLHAEGHPALWYLILKFVQFLGMPYKYLFILPIIFSSIGVYIFVFRSKFPWYIKCLFPFTFFVFYQYTIVARSYCLIFPLIALLATIWKDRYDKIWIFTLILILLINCEIYTYLLAGSIYSYCLLETFIDFRKGIKKEKKVYISFIILFLSFLVTLLYVFPTSSTQFPAQLKSYLISDSFFTPFYINEIVKAIISLLIIGYIILFIYQSDMKRFLVFILMMFPIIIFMNFIYAKPWHYGIITEVMLFIFWIEGFENKKSVKIFLIAFCIVQLSLCSLTSKDDYYEVFSPAEEVAEFLKEYDYNNLNVVCNNFRAVAINSYFDNNIFSNMQSNVGFLYLDTKNEFMSNNYENEYIKDNDVDIYVSSFSSEEMNYEILNYNYNLYEFEGNVFFQGRVYEDQTYWVYVKKDIDEQKTKES